jgi:hypothetical protein
MNRLGLMRGHQIGSIVKSDTKIGFVVISRNKGERLKASLRARKKYSDNLPEERWKVRLFQN